MFMEDLGMKYPKPNSKVKRRFVELACDTCGEHFETQMDSYKRRNIKECPAHAIITAGENRKTHGLSNTRLHNIWLLMRNRCNNKNYNHYNNYGGRGVTVCEEWDKFESFHEWSINNGYSDTLTIDKDILCKGLSIDPPVYSPSTCKWVDRKTQQRNTRVSVMTQDTADKAVQMLKDGIQPKNIVKALSIPRSAVDTIKAGSWQ